MAINYWDDVKEEATGTYEQPNPNAPIPEGEKVLSAPYSMQWEGFPGSDHKHINVKWAVIDGEYEGKKFFQSIYLNGTDPSGQYYKANEQDKIIAKAKAMFVAIDKNAGGHIVKSGKEPTDELMEKHIKGSPMMITVGVKKDGKDNVVRGVSPAPADTPKPTPKPKQDNVYYDRGSDIPF